MNSNASLDDFKSQIIKLSTPNLHALRHNTYTGYEHLSNLHKQIDDDINASWLQYKSANANATLNAYRSTPEAQDLENKHMRVFTQVQVFVDRLNLFNEVKMERGQAEKTKKKGTEELEPLGATGIYDKDAWIVFDG